MAGLEHLEQLSGANIGNTDTLVNIENVSIDTALPAGQRMAKYLEEIKNPYCFLFGKTPVKLSFDADGAELGEALKRFFLRTKR